MRRVLVPIALAAWANSAVSTSAIAPGDALLFAVPQGSEIEKGFTLEHQLVAQKIEREGPGGGPLQQQGLEVVSKIELSVVDTYRKMDGSRPLELRRLFRSCDLHVDLSATDARGVKSPDSADAQTPIQGKSVVYTWVPEEKTYGRYYDEEETLEEYLAGLTEDLDLRCLLPERDAHVGSTWTIEPARLVDVFVAGGDMPLGFVKGGGGTFARVLIAGVGGPLHAVFGGTVKGAVSARWKETREASLETAGASFAVVELTVAIETEHESTEAPDPTQSGEESPDASTGGHSGVHWKFEGTGTLVWNLAAGRFETFDLVGREDVSSDLTLQMGAESSRQVMTMAGSLKLSARAGAVKK